MTIIFKCLLILCVAAVVKTKYLHMKESYTEKNDDINFQDFFNNYDDGVYTSSTDKSRYARHVELVTESVLDHLLKEINHKYPQSKNNSQNIPKMMQRLKMKLKRMNKKKNKNLKKLTKLNMTKVYHETTTIPV